VSLACLRRLGQAYKRVARGIADVQARVFLTAFFFTIATPFALAMRWGADPLALGRRGARGWQRRAEATDTPLARARRQS
jgi:hypothetical protein